MKFTEHGFNRFIAACQWSSSWFIASAFLMVLLGVKVPEDLGNAFLFTLSLSAPLFLVLGMFQCWKLTDDRKWLALPAILVLLVSGAMMFAATVDRDRNAKAEATRELVHESAAWMTAKTDYDAAMQSYTNLAARTFPADYPKRFEENEIAKTKQWVEVQKKSSALTALEPAITVEPRTAFDIFGSGWSWLVASVFVFLYELSNHAIALALAYRPKETAPKPAQTTQTRAAVFGVDEYIEAAKRLGRGGVLAGYRQVAEEMGQTTYRCRELFGEAIATGKIKKAPDERGARETA